MRRLAVTALICVAGAGIAGAALAAPELARSRAFVRVKSCSIDDHSAVFYARMRKVHGTRRMKLKFSLLERPSGLRRFTHVSAPALTRWHKSAEGVKAYGFSQEVRGLHDGSTYRMRVRYRWYGADHKLLRSARRTSRACRMFVPLPNLKVHLLGHRVVKGGWSYGVRVTNSGQLGADDVLVQFSIDGTVVETRTISHIDPGEVKSRWTRAEPRCLTNYSASADPDNAIAESDESDNAATGSCG